MSTDKKFQAAFAFFKEHGASTVGGHALDAYRLAKAERAAEERSMIFWWGPDDDADFGE